LNAAFAPLKNEVTDIPVWRQPEVIDLARSFAWPLGTLALAALVLLGVIKPAMKSMAQTQQSASDAATERGNQLDAMEAEQPARPQLSASHAANEPPLPTNSELRLEDARKLTRDNPAAVANIVKAWINGEAPA
jgi:flagellar M-ring protein FliF